MSGGDGNRTDTEFGGAVRSAWNRVVEPSVLGRQEGIGETDLGIQIEPFRNGEQKEAVCRSESVCREGGNGTGGFRGLLKGRGMDCSRENECECASEACEAHGWSVPFGRRREIAEAGLMHDRRDSWLERRGRM